MEVLGRGLECKKVTEAVLLALGVIFLYFLIGFE